MATSKPTDAAAAATLGMNALGAGLLAAVHAPLAAPPPGDKPAGSFVSPISVSLALVLLLNGAEEGSVVHRQLAAALTKEGPASDGPASDAAIDEQYSALLAALDEGAAKGGDEEGAAPLTLTIATSVWAKPPLQFQAGYLQAAQEKLRSSAHALTGAPAVNDWVSHETRGLIKDLVDPGMVARAVAILVSAVYFKGTWQFAFDEPATAPAPFTLSPGGAPVSVPMMYKKFGMGQAGYTRAEGQYEAVRLPYKGGQFAAVALLPDAGAPGGCSGLVARLAAEPGMLGAARWARQELMLWLPRFKLECSMSLKSALQGVGVTAPFAPSKDFSRMLDDNSSLLVDDVVHKVFIEVNEKGTEAAAATAAVMMRAMMPLVPPHEVRLDRPFVFGVQHVPSGAMLFLGVVERPELAKE